jgi:hypothetical protein
MHIKDKIETLRSVIRFSELEIEKLQDECDHPEYEEVLNIIGCIVPIEICVVCDKPKECDYEIT